MKLIIEIDCETINQLHNHLTVLKKQIRSRAKQLKLDHQKEAFQVKTEFYDDNCYGMHMATVIED